jgi:hypothetical protein
MSQAETRPMTKAERQQQELRDARRLAAVKRLQAAVRRRILTHSALRSLVFVGVIKRLQAAVRRRHARQLALRAQAAVRLQGAYRRRRAVVYRLRCTNAARVIQSGVRSLADERRRNLLANEVEEDEHVAHEELEHLVLREEMSAKKRRASLDRRQKESPPQPPKPHKESKRFRPRISQMNDVSFPR